MSNLLKEPPRTCWNSLEGSLCSDTSLEADWAGNILRGLHPAPLILDMALKKAIWRPTWWGRSSSSVPPALGAHEGSPGQSPAGPRRWCSWWPGWRRSPSCPWAPAGLWSWRSPGQAQIKVSSLASAHPSTQYPRHVSERVLVETSRSMKPASNAESASSRLGGNVYQNRSQHFAPLSRKSCYKAKTSATWRVLHHQWICILALAPGLAADYWQSAASLVTMFWAALWLLEAFPHTMYPQTISNRTLFFLTITFLMEFPQPLLLK